MKKNICQHLLTIENTDSDLKASARAALCKLATPTRQTCLSKTFANSPNKQKLSKEVLVTINHCLGNSQINSIPAWSKEFSNITFLQNTRKSLRVSANRYYSLLYIRLTMKNLIGREHSITDSQ